MFGGLVDNLHGGFGLVDNLYMTYEGNMLTSVRDVASRLPYAGATDFDGMPGENPLTYNASGSLVSDAGRGIARIDYDRLNNPVRIQFTDGSVTRYVYSTTGEKLRVIHQTAVPNITVAIGSARELAPSEILSADSTDYLLGGSLTLRNGRIDKYQFEEGYCQAAAYSGNASQDNFFCYYYDRDHLGNVRQVVRADRTTNGTLVQTMDYYPFGAQFCDGSMDSEVQSKKNNGKEFENMHGLNTYDYGARQYNPVTARWDRVAPLSEKYYDVSPYAYCHNNPVRYFDPDGNDDWDKLAGKVVGTITNIVPFTGAARDLYSPTDDDYYNSALRTTDNAFNAIGEGLINVGKGGTVIGMSIVATSSVAVAGSGGTAAVVGAPAAATGATIAVTGAATDLFGALIKLNVENNKGDGYDRGKRTGASNNERHGDGGRAISKSKRQISHLQEQAQSATSKKERQRINKKIEHIIQNALKKQQGEEHK